MTTFKKLDLKKLGDKGTSKKTRFTKFITIEGVVTSSFTPTHFINVIHIGSDCSYGDVFIAYDNDPSNFRLFFGEAGDEFKDNGE